MRCSLLVLSLLMMSTIQAQAETTYEILGRVDHPSIIYYGNRLTASSLTVELAQTVSGSDTTRSLWLHCYGDAQLAEGKIERLPLTLVERKTIDTYPGSRADLNRSVRTSIDALQAARSSKPMSADEISKLRRQKYAASPLVKSVRVLSANEIEVQWKGDSRRERIMFPEVQPPRNIEGELRSRATEILAILNSGGLMVIDRGFTCHTVNNQRRTMETQLQAVRTGAQTVFMVPFPELAKEHLRHPVLIDTLLSGGK